MNESELLNLKVFQVKTKLKRNETKQDYYFFHSFTRL